MPSSPICAVMRAEAVAATLALAAWPALAGDAALTEILAIEGDAAYGEYLSGECTTCHSGDGARIPPLNGLPGQYMVTALHDYSTGHRDNATMGQIAKALGPDEMAALAAYFETAE